MMRLRIPLILVFLASASLGLAQSKNTYLMGRTMGEINLTSRYVIYTVDFDRYRKEALVQLRLTNNEGDSYKFAGYLALLDLQTGRFKWEQPIKTFTILRDSNILLQIRPNKSYLVYNRTYRLNSETGKIIWETKSLIKQIERKHNIGIGFEYRNPGLGTPKVLNGINLSDGTVAWSRALTTAYGWNETLRLDATNLLIVSDGLHAVNITTGKGWDYAAKTGLEDYKMRNIAAGIDFTYFLATGYSRFTPATLNREFVSEVSSSPLVTPDRILFASSEELACLDYGGKFIWKAPLPKDQTSKSELYIKDSTVYLLNKGYAYFRGKVVSCGTAFLAGYDLHTGKRRFMNPFDVKKWILGDRMVSDGLVLLFNDKIVKYANNGQVLHEYQRGTFESPFRYFVGDHVLVPGMDSALTRLTTTDPTHSYVFTTHENILSFNQNLELGQTSAPFSSCYLVFDQANGKALLYNQGKTAVMDETNRIITEFNGTLKARIVGQSVYDVQVGSLLTLDLKKKK